MKTRWLMVFACLLFVACEKSETTVTENAEAAAANAAKAAALVEYTALESEFDTKMTDFRKAYKEATKEEKKEIVDTLLPKAADYVDRFMAVADSNPGTDAACESLVWVATHDRSGENSEKAYETLFNEHVDNEAIKGICRGMGFAQPSAKVEGRLRKLAEDSPHDSVRGLATFGLSEYLSRVESAKESIEANPEMAKRYVDSMDYLTAFEVDPTAVENLYETMVSKYGGVKPYDKSDDTLKSLGESALFELRNLSIGKMAPDIEGADLDGKSFKLSDYRGKVVVLDFWGDW